MNDGKLGNLSTALLVLGALKVIWSLMSLAGAGMMLSAAAMQGLHNSSQMEDAVRAVAGGAVSTLEMGLAFLLIYAAPRVKARERWTLAVAACSAALFPFDCCCPVSVGIGVWGLTTLYDPAVKASFAPVSAFPT